jgi:Ran GTPase-activating protein (RanGAP) involved in mRNA processing and transport
MALLQNPQLSVLKLGYNNLGDAGVQILASAIAKHPSLTSLDLGFNQVGDAGCRYLATALVSSAAGSMEDVTSLAHSRQTTACHELAQRRRGSPSEQQQQSAIRKMGKSKGNSLRTLFLAGNCIGPDGAMALADFIATPNCPIRLLYLTGNRIGDEGVSALCEAIAEHSSAWSTRTDVMDDSPDDPGHVGPTGVEELYLGGTGVDSMGCHSIARMLLQQQRLCGLESTQSLRVLSLSNCDLDDDKITLIARSFSSGDRQHMLESLQLSFNHMTCQGFEALIMGIRGSRSLKELQVDNNKIGDRGFQALAESVSSLASLTTLNVGFNKLQSDGIKTLMKAMVESKALQSLALCGNLVDTSAAKTIAYALAYSRSIVSLSLVHCSVEAEGQRHIAAGIVSNAKTSLRELTGFDLGPAVITLGFPPALEAWNNKRILDFVQAMWGPNGEGGISVDALKQRDNRQSATTANSSRQEHQPLHASIVVETAKKTYNAMLNDGLDIEIQASTSRSATFSHSADGIVVENNEDQVGGFVRKAPNHSFVVAPEVSEPASARRPSMDPERRKCISEWFSQNAPLLRNLAQLPFSSADLWRLHQHFFAPVVNESGGSVVSSPIQSVEMLNLQVSSVPDVSRVASNGPSGSVDCMPTNREFLVPMSAPAMQEGFNDMASSDPAIKRKISYRFLGDASSAPARAERTANQQRPVSATERSVSSMIEGGHLGHKTKRARRNRTRISFLPRAEDKLSSLLDVCHERALQTMRQLYYVEQAMLQGKIYPLNEASLKSLSHLHGDLATDAETILVEML